MSSSTVFENKPEIREKINALWDSPPTSHLDKVDAANWLLELVGESDANELSLIVSTLKQQLGFLFFQDEEGATQPMSLKIKDARNPILLTQAQKRQEELTSQSSDKLYERLVSWAELQEKFTTEGVEGLMQSELLSKEVIKALVDVSTGKSMAFTQLIAYLENSSGKAYTLDEILQGRVPPGSSFTKGKAIELNEGVQRSLQIVDISPPQVNNQTTMAALQHFEIPFQECDLFEPVFYYPTGTSENTIGFAGGMIKYGAHTDKRVEFKQSFRQNPPDARMVVLGTMLAQADPRFSELESELRGAAEGSHCSNGNICSLAARYKATNAVALDIRKSWMGPKPKRASNLEAYVKLLYTRMPRTWPVALQGRVLSPETFEECVGLLSNDLGGIIPVNANASPGLVYDKDIKQGDRYLADWAMMLAYLKASNHGHEDFFRAYPHLLYTPLKAKFEVNPLSKPGVELSYLSIGNFAYPVVKSRNYYPVDAAGSMPAKILYKATHKQLHAASDPHEMLKPHTTRAWSLLGTKLFKGGMHSFFAGIRMKMNKKQGWFGAYSDNVYGLVSITSKVTEQPTWYWVSMDGVKMEGAADDVDFVAHNKMLFKGLGVKPRDGVDKYFEEIHPKLSCNLKGVLGNTMLPIDGQVSGNAATAQINTGVSLSLLDNLYNDLPPDEKANEAVKMISVTTSEPRQIELMMNESHLKEMKSAKFGQKRASGFKPPLNVAEYFSVHPSFTAASKGVAEFTLESVVSLKSIFTSRMTEIPVDYLGYSAVVLDKDKFGFAGLVPVLARDRLIRSIVNNKTSEPIKKFKKKQKGIRELEENPAPAVERWVTLWALYLIGGWFYEDLSQVIKARMKELKTSIKNHYGDLSNMAHVIESAIQLNPEIEALTVSGLDVLTGSLFLNAYPSMTRVLELLLPPEGFKKALAHLIAKCENDQDRIELFGFGLPSHIKKIILEVDPTLETFLQEEGALTLLATKVLTPAQLTTISSVENNDLVQEAAREQEKALSEDLEKHWYVAGTQTAAVAPLSKKVPKKRPKGAAFTQKTKDVIDLLKPKLTTPELLHVVIITTKEETSKKKTPEIQAHVTNVLVSRLAKILQIPATEVAMNISLSNFRISVLDISKMERTANTELTRVGQLEPGAHLRVMSIKAAAALKETTGLPPAGALQEVPLVKEKKTELFGNQPIVVETPPVQMIQRKASPKPKKEPKAKEGKPIFEKPPGGGKKPQPLTLGSFMVPKPEPAPKQPKKAEIVDNPPERKQIEEKPIITTDMPVLGVRKKGKFSLPKTSPPSSETIVSDKPSKATTVLVPDELSYAGPSLVALVSAEAPPQKKTKPVKLKQAKLESPEPPPETTEVLQDPAASSAAVPVSLPSGTEGFGRRRVRTGVNLS